VTEHVEDWETIWSRVTSTIGDVATKEEFEQLMIDVFFKGKVTGNRGALIDELWDRYGKEAEAPEELEEAEEVEGLTPEEAVEKRRRRGRAERVPGGALEAVPIVEAPAFARKPEVVVPEKVETPAQRVTRVIGDITSRITKAAAPQNVRDTVVSAGKAVRDTVVDVTTRIINRIRQLGG
jgi:hypothetical protein